MAGERKERCQLGNFGIKEVIWETSRKVALYICTEMEDEIFAAPQNTKSREISFIFLMIIRYHGDIGTCYSKEVNLKIEALAVLSKQLFFNKMARS